MQKNPKEYASSMSSFGIAEQGGRFTLWSLSPRYKAALSAAAFITSLGALGFVVL